MNSAATKIAFIFLLMLSLSGCNQFFAPATTSSQTNPSNLPVPTKEILVNNDHFNKPHEILGPLSYTLKSQGINGSDQIELRDQAIDALKREGFAKYGGKMDAIMDLVVAETTEDKFDGELRVIRVSGIAIAFIPEKEDVSKTKRKQKSTAVKTKPSARSNRSSIRRSTKSSTKPLKASEDEAQKKGPDEKEITPSELLK